jgi:hypothetical protein
MRPTPIVVGVGAAAHRTDGQLRVILSAIAAAAALYGAVVCFGLGPTSPVALGEVSVRPHPVVHVHMRVRDNAVPRPVQRLPQVSPGRAQRRITPVRASAPAKPHARSRIAPATVVSSIPPAQPSTVTPTPTPAPETTQTVAPPTPAPTVVLPDVVPAQLDVQLPPLQLPG